MVNTLGEWVRGLRRHLKLTQAEFAERCGIGQSMLSKLETGSAANTSQTMLTTLHRIARRSGYPVDGVALAIGADHNTSTAPIVGYVGAGSEVIPFDSYSNGESMGEVVVPEWVTGEVVALIVRGDSMHPIKDGWTLFYRRNGDGVPDECIGQLCVCETDDGQMYVKELRRGSENHCFNLVSWNAPIIENRHILWAAKVAGILPN